MRKRLIFIALLILIGGTAFYFYTKNKSTSVPTQPPGATTFFPSDSETSGGVEGVVGGTTAQTTTTTDKPSLFKQVSVGPVAGFTLFTTTTTKTIPSTDLKKKPTTESVVDRIVRYVSRENGYVYEIKNNTTPLQVSNIYIPNIYEAYFGTNGTTAILRFLQDDQKTIGTYSVPIPEENSDGTRTQKQGVYFPDNITSFAVSPDQKQVVYVVGDTQNSMITTATTTNTGRKEVVRNSFREWLVDWKGPKTLWLQTKASAIADGFLYKLDTTDKKLVRVIGTIKGLTTSVSPNGTYVFYSQSTTTGFVSYILNTKTGFSTSINLATLPEKCTWLRNEDLICAGNNEVSTTAYPDAWYKGTMTFKDKFYRIYTATNTYTILSDGSERTPDAINLQTDEDQGLLYFIDKPTGFLWKLSF